MNHQAGQEKSHEDRRAQMQLGLVIGSNFKKREEEQKTTNQEHRVMGVAYGPCHEGQMPDRDPYWNRTGLTRTTEIQRRVGRLRQVGKMAPEYKKIGRVGHQYTQQGDPAEVAEH